MKYLNSALFPKISLAVAAVASLGAFSLVEAQAQMLIKPATGTTIFESTEHGGGFSGAFAFDGTFNATQTGITNTGPSNGFAANGDAPFTDHNPILAFNLGSSFTINGLGYAQFNGATDTVDLVSTINVFSLTLAQYNTYTSGLVASGTTNAGTGNKAAPTAGNFVSEGSVTGLGAGGYTLFNFNNNSSTITGQYFVAQFVGNTTTQNPGAVEFELRAVPEPSSVALLGLGLGAAALFARRRLTA